MNNELGCSGKTYAIAGLVTYALTVLFIELTSTYLHNGAPPGVHGMHFYLPPTALLVFMFGLFTIGVSVLLGLMGFRFSIASRQWVWIALFSLFMLAELLGPAVLFTQPRISPGIQGMVALISALGVLLTLVASLVYSIRSPSD